MNNLLKGENKKRKRNKNPNKKNESFNRKNQNQAKTQNKFVNINGKWQKLENSRAGEIKISANEEFKKSLFGKDENEDYKPIQKNLKKNENAISEMEKEHSHIFSSSTNLEKILRAQREKYSSMGIKSKSKNSQNFQNQEKVSPSFSKYHFKTALAKNIVNYLNDLEISDRNIFSERNKENYEILYRIDLDNNFEIPMVTKKDKEKIDYKISFGLNENVYTEFEKVMIEIRDGTRRKKEINKDSDQNKNVLPLDEEDDEDIFAVDEKSKINILGGEKIKLNLTSNDEEDFFKFKHIDLATLLKPYQKK